MSQEIDLGGAIYISSKRAAEITGYAQDYIGQIARSGQIDAKKISGLWYVREDALRAYKEKADAFKPEPPARGIQGSDFDMSIAFDGREYISAARAAKLTGYTTDYVGQLAREGAILGRQIGNRWFVDSKGITAHKAEKDALLASVQAESVGLVRPENETEGSDPSAKDLHFTYKSEADMLPSLPERAEDLASNSTDADSEAPTNDVGEQYSEDDQERHIAIRVMPEDPEGQRGEREIKVTEPAARRVSGMTNVLLIVLPVIVAIGGLTAVYFVDSAAIKDRIASTPNEGGGDQVTKGSQLLAEAQKIFSKRLTYKRN